MVDGKRDARNRYFSLSVVTCAKQTNPTAVNPFVPLCDEGGRRGRVDATILSSRRSEPGQTFKKILIDPKQTDSVAASAQCPPPTHPIVNSIAPSDLL